MPIRDLKSAAVTWIVFWKPSAECELRKHSSNRKGGEDLDQVAPRGNAMSGGGSLNVAQRMQEPPHRSGIAERRFLPAIGRLNATFEPGNDARDCAFDRARSHQIRYNCWLIEGDEMEISSFTDSAQIF